MQVVGARTFSTRLYRKLWEPVTKTVKNVIGVQCRRNYELIMVLTSDKICYSLIRIPILDDNVVIMCPSDLIG